MILRLLIASIFVFGGALGWAVLPSLAGLILEKYPRWMPLVIMFSTILNMIVMIIIEKRGKRFLKARNATVGNTEKNELVQNVQ